MSTNGLTAAPAGDPPRTHAATDLPSQIPGSLADAMNPDLGFWSRRASDRLSPEIPLVRTPTPVRMRLASIAVIPAAGLALLVIVVTARVPWKARRIRFDRDQFEQRVLRAPPELATTRLAGAAPPRAFENTLERLIRKEQLQVDILKPATGGFPARVQLRLAVDPESLHPVEQEVLESLFGRAREVRSDLHRARHHASGFDPERVAARALEQVAFPMQDEPPRRRLGPWLAGLLLVTGILLALREMLAHDTGALTLAGGLAAAGLVFLLSPRRWWHPARTSWAAFRFLWPLALATLLAALLHILAPESLQASGSMALSLMLLGAFLFALSATRGFDSAIEQRYWMQRAGSWARGQLRQDSPSVQLAWEHHLAALGLAREFGRWRQRNGRDTPAVDTPGAASKPTPQPAVPESWSVPFYVPPAEDDAGAI